jgi:SP family xylose:H+ symportor-like MFS transporter
MSEIEGDQPKLRLPWNVFCYTAVVSFSSFVYGYNTGIIAPAIIFIPQSIPLSIGETGAVVSIILVGAILGAFGSGLLADAAGRRNVLAGNNALMLIAAFTGSLSESWTSLMISRFILGLGVGVASVLPALYITEVAPSHVRGRLGAFNQLMGWLGIITSYFVGYEVVSCTMGAFCWRYMFASGAVLCIFHFILVLAVLPDTPRWLVSAGREADALSVLTLIYGSRQDALIRQQYQVVLDRRDHQEPACLTYAEITKKEHQRPLLIALLMQFFQQATGNSAMIYYATFVFHTLGFGRREALLYNAIACIPQLIVLVAVVFTLDRAGRRPALLVSEAGIMLSLLMIGWGTTRESRHEQLVYLLVGLVLHRAFFAGGMGPVPSVLAAESLPFPIRGRGLSLAMSLNWTFNFIVTASFPQLMHRVYVAHVYWAFGLISLLGVFFIYYWVGETKGVSVDQIEDTGLSPNVPPIPEMPQINPRPELVETPLEPVVEPQDSLR